MTVLGEGLQNMIEPEREFMPQDVYNIGSMLSFEERLLLHHVGRTGPEGAIVDLGAFLGGSTLALASGAEHRDGHVDSFDMFRLAGEWEKDWFPEGFDAKVGDSTVPVYEHNIARVRDRVTVHEGDVREETWDKPIGVLFIDIAKHWSTGDAVWNTFFPWLQPGSIVIQQDLMHWGHPWCGIIMEHLAEGFDYLGWTWLGSSVWRRNDKPIEIPPVMLDAFTCDEMLELIERAARRVGWPGSQSIRLGAIMCLVNSGRSDEGRALFDEISSSIDDDQLPYISEGIRVYDTLLSGAAGKDWPH